jgi:hypothetical protein
LHRMPCEKRGPDYLRRVLRESLGTNLKFHVAGTVFAKAESPDARVQLHGNRQWLISALLTT